MPMPCLKISYAMTKFDEYTDNKGYYNIDDSK